MPPMYPPYTPHPVYFDPSGQFSQPSSPYHRQGAASTYSSSSGGLFGSPYASPTPSRSGYMPPFEGPPGVRSCLCCIAMSLVELHTSLRKEEHELGKLQMQEGHPLPMHPREAWRMQMDNLHGQGTVDAPNANLSARNLSSICFIAASKVPDIPLSLLYSSHKPPLQKLNALPQALIETWCGAMNESDYVRLSPIVARKHAPLVCVREGGSIQHQTQFQEGCFLGSVAPSQQWCGLPGHDSEAAQIRCAPAGAAPTASSGGCTRTLVQEGREPLQGRIPQSQDAGSGALRWNRGVCAQGCPRLKACVQCLLALCACMGGGVRVLLLASSRKRLWCFAAKAEMKRGNEQKCKPHQWPRKHIDGGV